MAFCIHCGKQLMDGARFCAFCGQSTNGNVAMQGNSAGSIVRPPVTVAPAVETSKSKFDVNKIIAHLHDDLGLDAEMTADGGVRVKSRVKNNGESLLDKALEVIITPEGHKLKGIRLPEGVTEIGSNAFWGAWNMEYIELPSTLQRIGRNAFYTCSLQEIHFPDSVTTIETGAFQGTRLSKVCLPANLKTLEGSVFSSCEKLTEVIFPSGLTEIGPCAFSECRTLQKVKIPQSVQRIGSAAFQGCKFLLDITIPAGVTKIERYTFDGCPNLIRVIFQPGIEIESDAFRGCKRIDANGRPKPYEDKVTPAKLPSTFDADKVIAHLRDYLGMDAEKAEDGGVRVTKRRYNEKVDMYELNLAVTPMTTPSGYKVKGITLPEGVTEIADQAFYMAWGLEYIELPSTLRKIGEEAFDDTGLVEIVIPEGVTEIGEAAFHDCNDLKKAVVKCPMQVMPAALFMACEELEEVVLPANLEEIESEAFEQCFKLKKLNLPSRLKNVAGGAFYECPEEVICQVKVAFPAYRE